MLGIPEFEIGHVDVTILSIQWMPAQTIFFAEMRERAGDARESSAFADADLVVEPVDLAIARADSA